VTALKSGTAEQKLAAAHEALRRTSGVQFDFPGLPQQRPPGWIEPLMRFIEAIAPALKYLVWAGLIAGAALVLWFVVQELAPERRGRRTELSPMDWRPEPLAARGLLQDADALAAEGRFAEAIHMLLFRSIDHLSAKRPGLVKPAFTSRDIARLQALPETPRHAFTRLAQAVEHSLFGGRPVDAEAFQRARGDYEAFAFAESWR
jgi:hypothetical protein